MISLYLVAKIRALKKKVIYICPNKPLCNEYSLFVFNQRKQNEGNIFALATEGSLLFVFIC